MATEARSIKLSVGRNGSNNPKDVKVVQALLNAALERQPKLKATGTKTLEVNGECDAPTLAALQAFQEKVRRLHVRLHRPVLRARAQAHRPPTVCAGDAEVHPRREHQAGSALRAGHERHGEPAAIRRRALRAPDPGLGRHLLGGLSPAALSCFNA